MAKQEFQTDLLGRAVIINLGMHDKFPDELLKLQDPDNWYAGWRWIGLECKVVGAYLDKERAPMLLVQGKHGGLESVYATHCAVTG